MQTQQKIELESSYSDFGKHLDLKVFADLPIKSKKSKSPPKLETFEINPQKSPKRNVLNNNGNRKKKQNTSAFLSVSREKKADFRYPIPLCKEELKYTPNFFYGKSNLPQFSFSKAQKIPKQKVIQYEICQRNPLYKKLSKESLVIKKQIEPIRSTMLNGSTNISDNKNIFLSQTSTDKFNYSILAKRQPSNIERYAKSKIESPRYLSKTNLLLTQLQVLNQNKKQEGGKVYIQMDKKTGRKQYKIKEFSSTENHFNNFKYSFDITSKIHDFNSYSQRKEPKPSVSPNYDLLKINLDKIREDTKRGYFNLKSYRDHITTRYDRVQPPAYTKLDYQFNSSILPNVQKSPTFKINKKLPRKAQLFPIVDPNLKRTSDNLITQQLKKQLKNTNKNIFSL